MQKMKADFPLLYGIWENPHHYYPYGRIKLSIALTRKEELECAQAARALPFPFGRKRKQKGPFRTALRQRQNEATNQPVRRTFPNSTPHGVSNTWEGSFLPLPCAAGAKIPSRATQSDSAGAASAFRKLLKRAVSGGRRKVSATLRNLKAIAPQSGNDRPRQHSALLTAWLVRGFPRAAGKRKGFMSEPP
ncbi:MAG: hypothetical protein SPF51_09145 [Candidatus Fimivicinus sp.]|nr:hypothetical protein [Candidatus Fimivicinus sp.]